MLISVGRSAYRERTRSAIHGKGHSGAQGSDEEESGIIELSPEHGFLDYHDEDISTCRDGKSAKSGTVESV